ncbi:hypothetical protein PV325_003435 [Microctonus aethiopoides]|nr:hypothetical protein PV325_003435 [Microctonus aethiopoides]
MLQAWMGCTFTFIVSHEILKNYIDSNPTTGSFVDIEDVESRVSRLERRLRAMEQPVWQIRGWPDDWEICVEGPCKCRPETKSISCWRYGLLDVPPAQLVPQDILKLRGSW